MVAVKNTKRNSKLGTFHADVQTYSYKPSAIRAIQNNNRIYHRYMKERR